MKRSKQKSLPFSSTSTTDKAKTTSTSSPNLSLSSPTSLMSVKPLSSESLSIPSQIDSLILPVAKKSTQLQPDSPMLVQDSSQEKRDSSSSVESLMLSSLDPSTKMKDDLDAKILLAELLHDSFPVNFTSRFADLVDTNVKYMTIKHIDSGSFSNVYQAQDRKSKATVALKEMEIDPAKPKSICKFFAEVNVLNALKHEYIVSLLNVGKSNKRALGSKNYDEPNIIFAHLVFEYCPITLNHLSTRKLKHVTLKAIAYQLLTAVDYIHKNGFIHRDLKPANVLVRWNGTLAVADFGLTIKEERISSTSIRGTRMYMAPEVARLNNIPFEYNNKSDIWSVGCILLKLFTQNNLMDPVENRHIYVAMCEYLNDVELKNKSCAEHALDSLNKSFEYILMLNVCSEDARHLLAGLLVVDPENRFTASQALSCTYFTCESFALDFKEQLDTFDVEHMRNFK